MICVLIKDVLNFTQSFFCQCQEDTEGHKLRLESSGIAAFLSQNSPSHFISTSRASLVGQWIRMLAVASTLFPSAILPGQATYHRRLIVSVGHQGQVASLCIKAIPVFLFKWSHRQPAHTCLSQGFGDGLRWSAEGSVVESAVILIGPEWWLLEPGLLVVC